MIASNIAIFQVQKTTWDKTPLSWPDLGPNLAPLDPIRLRETAASFPWRTSTGCDLHPRQYAGVSDTALQWLAICFVLSEAVMAIPDAAQAYASVWSDHIVADGHFERYSAYASIWSGHVVVDGHP